MRIALVAVLLAAGTARADDVLHVGTPAVDPPTLLHLGVTLPITGDDNFNATVSVRYKSGTSSWREALPLVHVHSEVVQGFATTPQFAGSIFDLAPDTDYTIELHAIDPDGNVDTTLTLTAHTRPVPSDPANPHVVNVTSAAELTTALNTAQPGDVITLAAGTYTGQFAIHANGTATDPIVIRGADDATILDGAGCTGCNVMELYGSYVHLEHLVLQHASRALKFQTPGMTDVVVRRVHLRDVTTGMSAQANQTNFYIEDNTLEGRLVWPCVYTSDDTACNGSPIVHGAHANDDGIQVMGTGHVVAHNTISGFGDAIKTEQAGATSIDIYNNDILWSYDNGIELDGSLRNTRALRNRITNVFAPISFQPIYGGPAYAVRNVIYNAPDEPFKLHSLGGTPTVGAMIVHNTIVRGTRELQCSTSVSPLYFTVEDNLFVGPNTLAADGHAVSWDVPGIPTATIDYNGFYPDGAFEYGYGASGTTYANFAAVLAAGGSDAHGILAPASVIGGIVGPADWTQKVDPIVPALPAGSPALDIGTPFANLDDGPLGPGPDLGALELGCAAPVYGVRPFGDDRDDQPCGAPQNPDDGGFGGDDPGTTPPGGGGGCGCGAAATPDGLVWICVVAALGFARRYRRSFTTPRA